MIIAPSVEITLTFHLILSSWHDYWLLAASELHWQHFILHVMPVSYLPTYLSPPDNAYYIQHHIKEIFSDDKLSRSRNVCVIVNIATYVNILYNPRLTW